MRYGLLEAEEKIRSKQVKALIEGMRSQLVSPSDQAVADFFGVKPFHGAAVEEGNKPDAGHRLIDSKIRNRKRCI
jgi:hypothetical protein